MIIDAHCDVLCKLFLRPDIGFTDEAGLDVNLQRLMQAGALLQCFAVYLPEAAEPHSFGHVLRQIQLFHDKVLQHPEMVFVRTADDLRRTVPGKRIGAMLTLEGADGLQGQPELVRTLFDLGVRCLQPTWNYANWAADGVLEPRNAGLSVRGMRLVDECSRVGMILDMAHLGERGFWEAASRYGRPFIVSHANARAVCDHPRNLDDLQIGAVIQSGGLIGITFVPPFLHSSGTAGIDDVIRHIEHICALGGERHLMLGSDFDGIDRWVNGLRHPGQIHALIEALERRFPAATVEGICWNNAYRFFQRHLPQGHAAA